jgi:hypothetical protein
MTATHLKCRCGEVEIELTGKPLVQFYCHCDDCQAVHGAAYVPESVYPADALKVVRGEPKSWTLKRNPRFFCDKCGTRLFIEVAALKLRGLNGYLLPGSEFRAAFHVQCQFAVRPVVDALTHYKGMPKQFGGSDEVVEW